jgi:ATP-binding cassette subfamily F protein uup
MPPPLLFLQDIHLRFGSAPLLEGAELTVTEGERLCLVGRNGSGKSTLLKIAAGLIEAEHGNRFLQPGTTVRYLPQEPDFTGHATVRAFVEAGLAPGDDPNRAYALIGRLGLTGDEQTARLSGGEARRAALARVLAPRPDVLLLDEPTNHLDLPAIEWLEEELSALPSALVLISHDRRLLERLSRATLWLDRGRTRRLHRGFAEFELWRDTELEQEEREAHKLSRKIAREEDWVRYGVTARRKRNVRRMAELAALRQQRRERRRTPGTVKMAAAEGEGASQRVIEARAIAKTYGDQTVVRDLSLRILRGDRVGLVGRNGAGKTTLLNLLTGVLAPDAGEVIRAETLAIATLDQTRASLDPGTTLAGALTGGHGDTVTVGGQKRHVMSYLKDFLFQPEQARTPVSVLSGGERARLLLARILAQPSNLLVLDEPTNDLDLETLDLLQELVASYAGTVLLVSHDRDFLDRTVTSVLFAEGDGRFTEYAGGYSDMLAQRGEGVVDKAKPLREKAPREGKAPSEPRRKLSFRDKHELETLPERIGAVMDEIARLQKLLSDEKLYARAPAEFDAAARGLGQAQDELARLEERWLALELKREDVEGKA